MKVFTAIVGATGACAMHYTEPHACAENIAIGISKVADSLLSVHNHHNADDIMGCLKHTYDRTQGLREVVFDCKKIALLPGLPTPKILPGVPPPEDDKLLPGVPAPQHVDDKMLPGVVTPPKILSGVPTPKYLMKNVTEANECSEDIQRIIKQGIMVAHSIEEANKAKSNASVLKAVKEVRELVSLINKAKAECSSGEMKAEVLRSSCARKIEVALSELATMEKDIKAVIGGDIMHAFVVENDLAHFLDLAAEVKKECLVPLEQADKIEKLTHVKRRDFVSGFADKLKELTSSVSTKIHKEAAQAACFGSSMSIVKDIKSLLDNIGKNMTFHGIEDTDQLHSHVSNAIVSCQTAISA